MRRRHVTGDRTTLDVKRIRGVTFDVVRLPVVVVREDEADVVVQFDQDQLAGELAGTFLAVRREDHNLGPPFTFDLREAGEPDPDA